MCLAFSRRFQFYTPGAILALVAWKTLTDPVAREQVPHNPPRNMSTSPEPSPANGRLSPAADEVTVSYANGDQSDSDLSDVHAADADGSSPDFVEDRGTIQGAAAGNGFEEASEPSDGDGSDDADFDMAESVASANSDDGLNQPASSNGSHRTPKRKAPAASEDDFMRNDPELYGLRRSVRLPDTLTRVRRSHQFGSHAHNPVEKSYVATCLFASCCCLSPK